VSTFNVVGTRAGVKSGGRGVAGSTPALDRSGALKRPGFFSKNRGSPRGGERAGSLRSSATPTFLIESYLPERSAAAAATAAALLADDRAARCCSSLLLPQEEIAFHVVDGPSVEAVREATARGRMRCQRISEAVLISSEDMAERGASP
jgi:hypothetical protein